MSKLAGDFRYFNNYTNIEGILYHMAFNVVHELWNINCDWLFIKKSIISRLPNWLNNLQKENVAEDISLTFFYLKNHYPNDKIINFNKKVNFLTFNGIIDALVLKKCGNKKQYVIREIKTNQDLNNDNEYHLNQLALYAIGLENIWELPNQSVTLGEVVSIFPPYLKQYNLTKTKYEIIEHFRGVSSLELYQNLKMII